MSAENVYHTESDNIFNDGGWTLAPSGQSMNMHERKHMGQSVGSVKVLPLIDDRPGSNLQGFAHRKAGTLACDARLVHFFWFLNMVRWNSIIRTCGVEHGSTNTPANRSASTISGRIVL
jgi:hypothetical protein